MGAENSCFAKGLAVFLAALALAGHAGQAISSEQSHGTNVKYLVGPDPSVFQGIDYRFRISLPSDYLPASFLAEFANGSAVSSVVFIASLQDLGGAGNAMVNNGGVFSGRISWAPDDYVRKRVDGSWLNHFSQYSIPVGEKYGLEARETASSTIDPSTLYISLSSQEDTLIECNYFPAPDRPQLCGMKTKRPGKPLLSITILQSDLSQWRNIRKGANELLDQWNNSTEDGDK